MSAVDSLLMPSDIQMKLAKQSQNLRLAQNHSRETAAKLTGVPVSTLKTFELTGKISLKQFLMICHVYGDLGNAMLLLPDKEFQSMDDMLASQKDKPRKRGRQ